MKRKLIKTIIAGAAGICILYAAVSSSYNNASDTTTSTEISTDVAVAESQTDLASSDVSSSSSTEITTSTSKDTDSTSIQATDTSSQDTPTLSEYLSSLRCDGCGRNCLLSNPQCHTGDSEAETATAEYNDLYNS